MGLFEWIFDNLYIVVVIGFVFFFFLGKVVKLVDLNKKCLGNGMFMFGGSGEQDCRE